MVDKKINLDDIGCVSLLTEKFFLLIIFLHTNFAHQIENEKRNKDSEMHSKAVLLTYFSIRLKITNVARTSYCNRGVGRSENPGDEQ